jgi:hypothetical protein
LLQVLAFRLTSTVLDQAYHTILLKHNTRKKAELTSYRIALRPFTSVHPQLCFCGADDPTIASAYSSTL